MFGALLGHVGWSLGAWPPQTPKPTGGFAADLRRWGVLGHFWGMLGGRWGLAPHKPPSLLGGLRLI